MWKAKLFNQFFIKYQASGIAIIKAMKTSFKKSLESPLNKRQTLLQREQRNIEAKSEEKIQRKNEK